MKVSNNNPNAVGSSTLSKTGQTQATDASKKSQTKTPISSEQIKDSSDVKMSDKARSMQKAMELARPNDGIDEAKVARLQKLIDEGKYKIDASAIAEKMVDEHLLMPS